PSREEREATLAELRKTGHLRGFEVLLKRLDGSPLWARLTETSTLAPDGTEVYDGLIEDVTAQKLALDALYASEERNRLLLEQIPALLWTTDRELRFTL